MDPLGRSEYKTLIILILSKQFRSHSQIHELRLLISFMIRFLSVKSVATATIDVKMYVAVSHDDVGVWTATVILCVVNILII